MKRNICWQAKVKVNFLLDEKNTTDKCCSFPDYNCLLDIETFASSFCEVRMFDCLCPSFYLLCWCVSWYATRTSRNLLLQNFIANWISINFPLNRSSIITIDPNYKIYSLNNNRLTSMIQYSCFPSPISGDHFYHFVKSIIGHW